MTLTSSVFRIVTSLARKSGIERDRVVNVYNYIGPSANPTSTDFGNWANNYTAFLTAIKGSLASTLSILPNDIDVGYWLLPANKGPLGAPKMELKTTLPGVGTGAPLPSEVAICMTLQADITGVPEQGPGGARPASRRRNRKYFGPLDNSTLSFIPTIQEPRPTQSNLDNLIGSYEQHMYTAQVTNGWVPVCFSPANWDAHPVLLATVDDAFDSQRRRGNDPTAKTQNPIGTALLAQAHEAIRRSDELNAANRVS